MTPYVTKDYFDDYVKQFVLVSELIDRYDTNQIIKAINLATRAIDNLAFVGIKTDSSQENEFPRGGDIVVPERIKHATCEETVSTLLKSMDTDDSVVEQAMGGVRMIRRPASLPVNQANGIRSPDAWRLLLPFLIDGYTINLTNG
jgi:hypothetical protein